MARRGAVGMIAVLAALGGACVAERRPDVPAVDREAIFHGTADTTHSAVVALKVTDNLGDTYLCSGTIIAPRLVLTAGHCLEGTVSGIVGFGPDINSATWVDITEFIPHPQWTAISGQHPYRNDLALVRIASQPDGIRAGQAAPAAAAIQSADVGTLSMEFVGYGKTETGATGTKLHTTATLDYACLGANECTWWHSVWSYALISPGAICHLRTSTGTCKGDSGGPALVMRNGQEYIAGVSSFGDTACTSHGCNASIDHAFLDPYIAAAQPTGDDAGVPPQDAGAEQRRPRPAPAGRGGPERRGRRHQCGGGTVGGSDGGTAGGDDDGAGGTGGGCGVAAARGPGAAAALLLLLGLALTRPRRG